MLRSAGLPARRVPQTVTARARESPRAGHQWGPCPANGDLNHPDVATSGTRLALRRPLPVDRPTGPSARRAAGLPGRRSAGLPVRRSARPPVCPVLPGRRSGHGPRAGGRGPPARRVPQTATPRVRESPRAGHPSGPCPANGDLTRPEVPTSGTRPAIPRPQPAGSTHKWDTPPRCPRSAAPHMPDGGDGQREHDEEPRRQHGAPRAAHTAVRRAPATRTGRPRPSR